MISRGLETIKRGWKEYMHQLVSPSLAYMHLYFNAVLAPCNLMIAFLTQCGRMWCYCRMVYLPLYGKKFVGSITPNLGLCFKIVPLSQQKEKAAMAATASVFQYSICFSKKRKQGQSGNLVENCGISTPKIKPNES